jgi:hypothetical protein
MAAYADVILREGACGEWPSAWFVIQLYIAGALAWQMVEVGMKVDRVEERWWTMLKL